MKKRRKKRRKKKKGRIGNLAHSDVLEPVRATIFVIEEFFAVGE